MAAMDRDLRELRGGCLLRAGVWCLACENGASDTLAFSIRFVLWAWVDEWTGGWILGRKAYLLRRFLRLSKDTKAGNELDTSVLSAG